ncbi:MAG: molybdopterin molybdotransferase MoeA [Candidatus Omnitrophica bacterium]|nr:molybdopterin molybdotransferase MoeA [Candidatus Omnitrophota bacterium]
MISCEQALKLIEENNPSPKEEEAWISAALGLVCAEDVRAPLDLPLYDNSAMDGFVLRSEDTRTATAEKPVLLSIRGVVKAGDDGRVRLDEGKTYRIMTGAPIIKGGDAVLEKEKAFIQDNCLVMTAPAQKGRNIRYQAEEVKKSELALPKGSVITPGTIGFLATMGMNRVTVYKKPAISLITTGSELTAPGGLLRPGKIYDSNTAMIQAALEEMRIRPFFVRRFHDVPKTIQKVMRFALKESDIVILMGGVSVGDYDFVKGLLEEEGVKTIFWKVSQKPGKPLYFGRKENRLVFGFPGNPASVFTCFYEYVYPAIRRFMGYQNPCLFSSRLKLKGSLKPDPEKVLFIKSKIENGEDKGVLPLRHQKSHMISSLCQADSFVVVQNSETVLEEGEKVLVHALPFASEGVL